MSPTIFGIYIDKLEKYLKDASFVGPILTSVLIILLIYVENCVAWEVLPQVLGDFVRIPKVGVLTQRNWLKTKKINIF